MDDAEKTYVDEVFCRRKLDSEQLKQLLDYSFENRVLDSIPEYERILKVAQLDDNRKLWQEISKVLFDSPNGFRIFQTFCNQYFRPSPKDLKFSDFQLQVKDKVLKIGGAPQKPELYVIRTNLFNTLINLFENYQNIEICLNGAIGMGKTTLVRCVVDDIQLLREKFNCKVFWLHLNGKTRNDCLKVMFDFYQRIIIHDNKLNLPRICKYPESTEIMRNHLLKIFVEKKSYNKALIILDDIQNLEIVENFRRLCNLLIISNERIDMENMTHVFIKEGFTFEESVEVFTKALKDPSDEYKSSFRKIHNHCKGDPSLIGFWAKRLKHRKDEFCVNPNKWIEKNMEYVKKEGNKKRVKVIEDWLKELKREQRQNVEKLLVFPPDTTLTPKVLETYWDISVHEVENLLQELEQKNFVMSSYNEAWQTSLYEFVAFFLDSIKILTKTTTSDENRIVSYHKELIEKYLKKYGKFEKFPNDYYIYEYLGYHLQQAKDINLSSHDYFGTYLNLDFIDAKIKATSYIHLLTDFKTYEKEIIRNNKNNELHLKELKKLVAEAGPNLTAFSSIVHYALNLLDNSLVYKDARRIVLQNDSTLYLKYSEYQKNYKITNKVTIEHEFKVALIVSSDDHLILVGLTNGDIELMHFKNVITKFKGHRSKIVSLRLNNEKNKLLSIDNDGTAKLWIMPLPEQIKESISQGGNILYSYATFYNEADKITCAVLCHKSKNVITGSLNGVIKIWKKEFRYKGETKSIQLDKPIQCMACLNSLIAVVKEKETIIYIYSSANLSFQREQWVDGNTPIIQLHVPWLNDIPETLLVIQKNKIVKLSWVLQCITIKQFKFHEFSINIIYNGNTEFLLSALNRNYIALTDVDYKSYLIEFTRKFRMIEINTKNFSNVECMDTCIEEEGNGNLLHVLLRGLDDRTLRVCDLVITDKEETQGHPIYSCCWGDSVKGKNSPFIAMVSVANTIKFMGRNNLFAETEPEYCKVCAVHIRSDMDGTHYIYTIYYALENGFIKSYECKHKNSTLILDFKEKVTYFECLKDLLLLSSDTKFAIYDIKQKRLTELLITSGIMRGFLLEGGKLLTIDKQKATIRCWLTKEVTYKSQIFYSEDSYFPSSAELSLDGRLLCITSDTCFNIFQLENNIDSRAKVCFSNFVDSNILCCGFSAQNELLAVGTEDGSIHIIYLNEKLGYESSRVLKYYKTPVKALLFAPFELILATLGDQFGLWNLKHLPQKRTSLNKNSNSSSKSMNSISLINGLSSIWHEKVGSALMPHLLASLKIDGLYTNRILASPNFEKFFTVDSGGVIHTIEVFKV